MILLLMLYHVLRVTLLYAGQRWPTLGGPMCTLMTAGKCFYKIDVLIYSGRYMFNVGIGTVLMHTGYCRPTASPPPAADIQELRATIRVLHPKDCMSIQPFHYYIR
jgi:hypothetical protein